MYEIGENRQNKNTRKYFKEIGKTRKGYQSKRRNLKKYDKKNNNRSQGKEERSERVFLRTAQ